MNKYPKSWNILGIIILLFAGINKSSAQLFSTKDIYNRADSLRGKLTPLRTCYDILYYHLDVKVDVDNKYISGNNLFKFKAVNDFNKLQFDLFDNLSVERVTYKGKELPFHREYNAVFVQFPHPILKGQIDSFIVAYAGHPVQATRAPWDGGFDWKKDKNGKPFVATACQGLGASVWWPNKDHQSDEVDSMLISVSVPKGLMNISNGRLVNTVIGKDGFDRFDWKVTNPINNYNIALNIGDYIHFKEVYQGEKGPLDMDYYILRENNSSKNRNHLKNNAHRTLQAFEHWFGPYPFYEDGYKLIETAHLGMEHQSAIAYGNHFQNGYLGRDGSGTGWGMKWDFIVVHESGHEWFGNNITSIDLADMWIHESFTNYSEALFIDYFYGKKASQDYVHGNRKIIQNDKPMQGPYNVNKSGSGDMYNKGGVMLNMVRTIIADDVKWREILRGLNKTFYHQQVDYDDIVDYICSSAKMDLRPLFEQYIKTTNIPTLEIHLVKDGKASLRWRSEIKDFNMPIHLGKKGDPKKIYAIGNQLSTIEIAGLNKENLEIDTLNYYIRTEIQ